MLTLSAPAKINLTLEVVGKRADGYHEIRSILQTISLCDTISFQLSQGISLDSHDRNLAPEDNLAFKAAKLLKEVTGCQKGATVQIEERIPRTSGLGRASSDAATTLRGLNELWELGLSCEELVQLASRLGSDTAFFIFGGTALAEGWGEKVTLLPALPPTWVVLFRPPLPEIPRKTEKLYASLSAGHFTKGQFTQRAIEALRRGDQAVCLPLFNVFEQVAFDIFPGLGEYREHFLAAGAAEVHLAGSGPALFTLVGDRYRAEEIFHRLQSQGQECYLAQTC